MKLTREQVLIFRLTGALAWSGAHFDFSPKGKYRDGWMKAAQPALDAADNYTKELGVKTARTKKAKATA
jgi:hypothetical protein